MVTMTTGAQLLTFAGVIALGAMSPGPDPAVVTRHAAVSGRAHGVATAAGITVGARFVSVASLVAASRRLLARPAVRRGPDRASGAVLIGLGVRPAVTGVR